MKPPTGAEPTRRSPPTAAARSRIPRRPWPPLEAPSVVIAPDGLAQIAHGFERFVYLTTCLDSACTRSISRRVFSQQATIDFVKIKMAVGADGIPSIAFSGANTAANSRTFFLRCLDADCAATAPVRDFGAIGEVLAIQLAPIGAAQLLVRTINNGLRLHRCADAACTSDQASTVVTDGGLVVIPKGYVFAR